MLRIKTALHLKSIEGLWRMEEEEVQDFLRDYEAMPCSRVTIQELNEMDKVKCIRTENKLYYGQI